jgi:hypothetical protein
VYESRITILSLRRFLPRWAGFPAVEMVLAANPMG